MLITCPCLYECPDQVLITCPCLYECPDQVLITCPCLYEGPDQVLITCPCLYECPDQVLITCPCLYDCPDQVLIRWLYLRSCPDQHEEGEESGGLLCQRRQAGVLASRRYSDEHRQREEEHQDPGKHWFQGASGFRCLFLCFCFCCFYFQCRILDAVLSSCGI